MRGEITINNMLYSPFCTKNLTLTQWFWWNSQLYKPYGLLGHNGIDLRAPIWKTLYSTHAGICSIHDDPNNPYGKYIKIRQMYHDWGYETIYAHLSKILVKEGQYIEAKRIIGRTGNTWTNTTWPHLHLGLKFFHPDGSVKDYDNGYKWAVDPISYFQAWITF